MARIMRERSILLVLFICGITVLSNGAPIKHMTDCERNVHLECVVKLGSSDEFTKQCQVSGIVTCLKNHLKSDACAVQDRDTIPTVKNLISFLVRKVEKEPKFCENKERFAAFTNLMKEHFTVQGEGIEFTDDPQISYEYSGSGDGVPDDTEIDGEDNDGDESNVNVTKNNDNRSNRKVPHGTGNALQVKNNNGTHQNNNNNIHQNSVRKNKEFWKETSRRILKGKQKSNKQILVYFDDPAQYRRNQERQKNDVSDTLKNAWERLKRRYQKWYVSSRFYKIS